VVSDKPVGVDIETIRPYKESLARYVMNDDELEKILHAENPALEFTKLWTQKEAVVKLSGHGISNDMKSVLKGFPFEIETVVTDRYVYSLTKPILL
jgi:4'-phosphopantetheinyl transferase